MSTTGDQMFRSEYTSQGKYPYILFGDSKRGAAASFGYCNNSLEGTIFDADDTGTGRVIVNSTLTTLNFKFYDYGATTTYTATPISIADGVCTIQTNTTHNYLEGDVVAITGILWNNTQPNLNGTWVVTGVPASNRFTFEINAADDASISGVGMVTKGSVFSIYDDRLSTQQRGKSFSSILFVPWRSYSVAPGYKRILPSDLYTRFRIQSYSDVAPKGGINSNLFNVLDGAGNNIKPVLWAYFFGYNDATISARSATHFEIVFNSYAIVLRPSGSGSQLEFALVKFNWGLIPPTTGWANIVGTDRFNQYTINGTELGYLISSNPDVGKVAGNSVVSEIAKSDSFTYNAEFPVKLNLKITIRKHLLSDSVLDGTYLVNLMVNDTYNEFGESAHYDTVLHGYISKPGLDITGTGPYLITDGTHPHDCMLMPIMYFKFNNTNEQNVGALDPAGSSKIVQDSLLFKQLNSLTTTSYLY